MDYRVHCHICPLKGICPDTIRHIQTSYRLEKNRHHQKEDVDKMAESTKNCPLKAMVFPDERGSIDRSMHSPHEAGADGSNPSPSTNKTKNKGVLYIDTSLDHKGFERLYENVKKDIFEPALKYMPTEDELKERMRKGLAEHKASLGGQPKP